MNKQEITDNIIIRTVEVDAERAPLVCWAFTEYATGNWTLLRLQQALTEKGLRTRKTAKRGAKEISINGLYSMLRNPYYMGVVPYRGAYHDGSHPALVDAETWLQVQSVLAAHNTQGHVKITACAGLVILSDELWNTAALVFPAQSTRSLRCSL